jgi:hypothetical protein
MTAHPSNANPRAPGESLRVSFGMNDLILLLFYLLTFLLTFQGPCSPSASVR